MRSRTDISLLNVALKLSVGKRCWYVSCGGSAGSSFKIAIGGMIPRRILLANQYHGKLFRQNAGEYELLVWCPWRLDKKNGPFVSSDCSLSIIERSLNKLIGRTVSSVRVMNMAYDAEITFSGGFCLRIFAEYLPPKPTFDYNWDYATPKVVYFFGSGKKIECIKRTSV